MLARLLEITIELWKTTLAPLVMSALWALLDDLAAILWIEIQKLIREMMPDEQENQEPPPPLPPSPNFLSARIQRAADERGDVDQRSDIPGRTDQT